MSAKERRLEEAISYILMGGVMLSLVVEVAGLLFYYRESGGFGQPFESEWKVSGEGFFTYALGLVSSIRSGLGPIKVMGLGIVLLMLTPFIRVAASVAFFGLGRDYKYLMITLFVLIVLTLSLLTQ